MRIIKPALLLSVPVLLAGCTAVGDPRVPSAALAAPAAAASEQAPAFAHMMSDLPPDARVVYGQLENGVRYAVMHNDTPSGAGAIRMQFGTGSLEETDAQQGIAHFLEHMAFNGSRNVPEGEMVKRLEHFGLSFGADTNASTGFDHTTYKLNLPNVQDDVLNEAFFLMRETADRLLLDPDAIERERGVIASEKLARDSINYRAFVDRLSFFTEGSGLTDRLPIGTDETIATMPREEFAEFYRGYYRPENTFLAFIGDLDPSAAIAKIEYYFGDWRPAGTALPDVSRKPAMLTPGKVGYQYNEKLMTSITLAALGQYAKQPDTTETRKYNLIRGLGSRILARRMQRNVEAGTAEYLAATTGRYRMEDTIDGMVLTLRTSPEDWQAALADGEQELRRALQFGFSQQELDEQIANTRQARETAVERAGTRKTYAGFEYNYAAALVDSFADEQVFTSPQTSLELFEQAVKTITLEDVESAFRKAWEGSDNPAIYFVTSKPLDTPEIALRSALQASQKVAVAPLEKKELGVFAYTDFGDTGQVVQNRYVEDTEAHLLKFANNVRLNFKQTDFDDGTIYLRVRVGGGFMSMPRKDEGLRRLGLSVLDQSGVVGHNSDELKSLFAGRRVFATTKTHIDNDAFEILGTTDADDLSAQLNLMAAKVKAPAFREEIADQFYRRMRAWYPTHDASPNSVADKYLPRLVRLGDKRYGYDDLDSFLSPTIDEVRDWIEPQFRTGLIEITVVGDIDKDIAVREIARTFGALPVRADTKTDFSAMRELRFPDGNATPYRFYHQGTGDQAQVYVYWPAPDASDPADAYRIQLLRGLFRNRLTDVLREEMGATYSPGTASFSNSLFDGYGYIYAKVTAKPDQVDEVRAGILRVANEMATVPIDEDTFKRAWTPIIEDLGSSLENNGYWMDVLGDAQTDADGLASFRARGPTYRDMTASEISTLAGEIFTGDTSVTAYILPRS